MTEILGVQTILSLALPTGVDGDRLARWAMRSGRTYEQWANDVAIALAAKNQELMDMWGELVFFTEDLMMEYEQGGAQTDMPEITDVDRVDPKRSDTIGHMLELVAYGDAFGGSWRWFRDAREAQLNANVRRIVRAGVNRFEKKLLTRIFSNTETQIGTNGYSVPFVRGTGGNVDFAPPQYGGEEFTTSHNHYNGVDTGSYGYDGLLNQLAEHLQEHGHEPPYIGYVSRANVSSYRALSDFAQPLGGTPIVIVDQAGQTDRMSFFSNQNREYGRIGGFESDYGYIELRATNRIPSAYAAVVKSYGQLDQRNPLAIRVHPDVGWGMYVIPETAQNRQYPINQLQIEFEMGIGVGYDRTNASIGYLVSGGVFVVPTIT